MCGTFSLQADINQLAEQFQFDPNLAPGQFSPRSTITPGNRVLALRLDQKGGKVIPEWMHWGMYPPTSGPVYAKARPVYNARSETANRRQTFMQALASRRCIILADCFYEWQENDEGERQPVRFHRRDRTPFGMAGIWNPNPLPNGRDQRCVIMTTQPNELVEPVHRRMPVLLEPQEHQLWLDNATGPMTISNILRKRAWPQMTLSITQPARTQA